MTIAVAIPEDWPVDPLIRWAGKCAQARREDLLVIQLRRRVGEGTSTGVASLEELDGEPLQAALHALLADRWVWSAGRSSGGPPEPREDASSALRVAVKTISQADPAEGLIAELQEANASLLILPRGDAEQKSKQHLDLVHRLLRDATCEVAQLRAVNSPNSLDRLAVAISESPSTGTALNFAATLAAANDARVTALFVEPDVDSLAESVGLGIARRVVNRSLRVHADRVEPQATIDNDVVRGIQRECGASDLLLLGASYHGVVRRFLFSSISEQLLSLKEGPPVMVIRPALPWTNRLWRAVSLGVAATAPQLDRGQRVKLVERVQSSSRWDFDFIALICLSTLIATLGLLQNSVAVVIGAMLVAPLMNPILGFGLSLVQGNVVLARNTARTILRGFCLAFAIAALSGLLIPNLTASSEMLARGAPRLSDLLVAFVSGVAAAYAMGRPNLLSALPGVAIAAALVPPIATSGLSVSMGEWSIAGGAALLFLTNIVAIVLGAAASLWITGVRGVHAHGGFARWAPRAAIALLVLASALGVYEAWPAPSRIDALREAVRERLDREESVRLISIQATREHRQELVEIVVGSETPLAAGLLDDLERAVRGDSETPVVIRIETRLVRYRRS